MPHPSNRVVEAARAAQAERWAFWLLLTFLGGGLAGAYTALRLF